jgi:hypothetical protein
MSEIINRDRRTFLASGVVTVAAAQLVTSSLAHAHPAKAKLSDVPPIKPGTSNSFTSHKQIDSGLLNVGYAEASPADGPAVVLLHGWPYDSFGADQLRAGEVSSVARALTTSGLSAAFAGR